MSIVVSVRVRVVERADIVHFEDVAAFGAALDGAVAGHLVLGLAGGLSWGGGGKREGERARERGIR